MNRLQQVEAAGADRDAGCQHVMRLVADIVVRDRVAGVAVRALFNRFGRH